MNNNTTFKSKSFIVKVVLYAFILLLPFIVFYWQAPFLSDMTIGNDYVAFPISQQMELQYSLLHGTFPLYVPGFAGGQTAAALTLGQLFHPLPHLAAAMPGYWKGNALEWNTLFRLFSLGLLHLGLFILLLRLGLNRIVSFLISFITVYNFRMLDLFHYGASLENYTGYLFLCLALAFYYLKPTRFWGPVGIIGSTYLLVCGGHPQMMYLGLLGAAIAGVVLPFVISKISPGITVDRRGLVKYFTTAVICVLGGILLASAYTIPFYYDFILTNAQRVGQEYQFSQEYSSSVTGMFNSFFAPLQSEVQGAFGSSALIILVMVIPFLYTLRVRVPVVVTVLWGVLAVIFLTALGSAGPLHYYFWKYFPMAQSFRAPGRLSMMFPFLFLLILAWLFRRREEKPGENAKPPYLFAGILAVVFYLVYHWIITGYVHMPKLKFCLPVHIKPYPSWLDPLMFWLGLFTLLLVVGYAFSSRHAPGEREKQGNKRTLLRYAVGLLLVAAVMFQVTVQFRHGTWVVKRTSQPTLAQMDQLKQRALVFRGDPGHGMESALVYEQKRRSILDPYLAKFYRKYKIVPDQKRAYSFLRKENATDTLVVEVSGLTPAYSAAEGKDGFFDLKKEDRVKLKECTFNRLVFRVEAQAPGFFALSFPLDKGWTARVDGKQVEIYRGNAYMQAVELGAGAHEIEFRYWSKAAFTGMLAACLAFLLMGGYFALFVFKGKGRVITALVSVLLPAVLFWAWSSSIYRGDSLGTEYKWTSKQFPPANNLAYAKKTAMSSLEWLFYPGLAVDGHKGRGFRTDRLQKAWWQVDLGTPQAIGEIVIYDEEYSGEKHLPLDIVGAMDGKTFTLLKRVKERGREKPWRIPMQGEITRFVRLNAPSKRILSFSEVEIYPPKMDVLDELGTGQKNLKNQIIPPGILMGQGAGGASGATDIAPEKLVDMIMQRKTKVPGDYEIKVWDKKGREVQEISPPLVTFGKWGKFKIEALKENEDNVIAVSIVEPDKEGTRRLHLGYENQRNGIIIDDVEGKYVIFIVQVAVPVHLLNRENYIAVLDYNKDGTRKAEKTYFSSPRWRTYVVSLKVRSGSQRLLFMLRFDARSAQDRLKIKDARIIISGKEF